MTSENMIAKISAAENRKLITPASFAELPLDCPFHVAFRLVEPRAGTLPPDMETSLRYASGAGFTADEASDISGYEAVERYSIQYSATLPEKIATAWTNGDAHLNVSVDQITLGSPRPKQEITSRGSATGISFDDAACRAVMELIEHTLEARPKLNLLRLDRASADTIGGMGDVRGWLGRQLRCIEIAVSLDANIGYFSKCSCHDTSFYRPTFGTAFGLNLSETIRRSCFEAVVSWRNMVSLEFSGTDVKRFQAAEASVLRQYRQEKSFIEDLKPSDVQGLKRHEAGLPTLERLAQCLLDLSGRPVYLFDLTAPEIEVPVVKAVQFQ